jgi:hypothetical protein
MHCNAWHLRITLIGMPHIRGELPVNCHLPVDEQLTGSMLINDSTSQQPQEARSCRCCYRSRRVAPLHLNVSGSSNPPAAAASIPALCTALQQCRCVHSMLAWSTSNALRIRASLEAAC